ncbi:MAG: hypothetical protein NZ583_06830 [Desulfobacterota bacterium]|nr:hypothetical protein [Thermodesulfobacteriota bacterium]MDW8002407.1 hypothetical protein [Deltaproteobacteria bacterium]
MRRERGRIGCGCLFMLLIVVLVVLAVLFHPLSLKFVGKQLLYADKANSSDIAFVPCFREDKNGEVYKAAIEELKKGSVKAIWIEEYTLLDTSVTQLIKGMAKSKGIKGDLIKGVRLDGKEKEKSKSLIEMCKKAGIKKVMILVPEYASRRYKVLYGESGTKGPLFFVNPVKVTFFNVEKWWRETLSRELVIREYAAIGSLYFDELKKEKIFRIKA